MDTSPQLLADAVATQVIARLEHTLLRMESRLDEVNGRLQSLGTDFSNAPPPPSAVQRTARRPQPAEAYVSKKSTTFALPLFSTLSEFGTSSAPLRPPDVHVSFQEPSEVELEEFEQSTDGHLRIPSCSQPGHIPSRPVSMSILDPPSMVAPPTVRCAMVESVWFQTLSLSATILGTFLVIVKADLEAQDPLGGSAPVWGYVDGCFTVFYTVELLLRIHFYRMLFFCGEDKGFNLFDLILVILSWFQVIVQSGRFQFLRSVRIIRIVRTVRVFRLLRFLRELRTMMVVVGHSMVSIFWSTILLAFVLAIYALVFVQLMTSVRRGEADADKDHPDIVLFFGSVLSGMVALFQSATGGVDWSEVYDIVSLHSSIASTLFVSYIIFFQIAIVNIITSTFVDKARRLGRDADRRFTCEWRHNLSDAPR